MRRRLAATLGSRRFQLGWDMALAGAILAGSLAEITAGTSEWSGAVAVELPVAFACSVPLAWRRSHPIAVLGVVAPAALASGWIVAPQQGPFETAFALFVVTYSIGVHTSRRSSVYSLVGLIGGLVVVMSLALARTNKTSLGDWVPVLVYLVIAWVLGRVIRSRNLRTLELERLTIELAAERDARAREAVTVERARIARELHDVIAHNISVMGVQAAAAGRVLEGDQPDVRRALITIETTGRATVYQKRRMLGVLRGGDDELALSPQPGLRNLDALVADIRASGLDVDLRVEGDPRQLPAGLDLSAYRIVQEALTNALKHAGQARATVVVRYAERAVELEVVDDGLGDPTVQGAGHGLVGMRERVALFGGDLDVGVRPEGGWAIRARLPVGAT